VLHEQIKDRLQVRQNIISRIQQRRLRYLGHVCLPDGQYPEIAIYGYVRGQRGRGRPEKRWVDIIRRDCEVMGTTIQDAIGQAMEKVHSRAVVRVPAMLIMALSQKNYLPKPNRTIRVLILVFSANAYVGTTLQTSDNSTNC
jgi:hypothetical protein